MYYQTGVNTKETIILEDSDLGREGGQDKQVCVLDIENSDDVTYEKIKKLYKRVGLYKMKNLYVNGCSFTGHIIEDDEKHESYYQKKMNLDLNCRLVNGSSMDSIYL